jgi:Domain of unknown function (DUF6391)
MTNAAYFHGSDWGNFDFFVPRPTQDTDLLKQLNFIPGLKEILMLRQVHALEHATVWVLSEKDNNLATLKFRQQDNETLGGLSTDKGFYLYGQVNQLELQKAVSTALQRLQTGEWDLAVHPRCGTNLSVAMLLTAGLVFGTNLVLPKSPLPQILGLSLAFTTAARLAPDLGISAQRYLTTSIPFNLKIQEILATSDIWGRSAHFVRVGWQELQ